MTVTCKIVVGTCGYATENIEILRRNLFDGEVLDGKRLHGKMFQVERLPGKFVFVTRVKCLTGKSFDRVNKIIKQVKQ